MAKKGGSNHYPRITTPKNIPVPEKKGKKWLAAPRAGPYNKNESVTLTVLLRDILKFARNAFEVRDIVNSGHVSIDGKVVKDVKRPIGIMDIIGIQKADAFYRIQVDNHGKTAPVEVKKSDALRKFCKVVKKHTTKKGKTNLTMHDGKNILGDEHIKVRDTVVLKLPECEMEETLKLEPGARCLVTYGKHAGKIATLEEVIQRKGSMEPVAKLKDGSEEFRTVAKYLFVVDGGFGKVE